jgi:hypothetical protein
MGVSFEVDSAYQADDLGRAAVDQRRAIADRRLFRPAALLEPPHFGILDARPSRRVRGAVVPDPAGASLNI